MGVAAHGSGSLAPAEAASRAAQAAGVRSSGHFNGKISIGATMVMAVLTGCQVRQLGLDWAPGQCGGGGEQSVDCEVEGQVGDHAHDGGGEACQRCSQHLVVAAVTSSRARGVTRPRSADCGMQ